MTLCTEHFTCSIFGTSTAVTTAAAAVVAVLTVTHRYNAVCGHRRGLYSSSPFQYVRLPIDGLVVERWNT